MIELREACFSFDGERNVVDHVSLTLSPGERLVLLGRNGSGKSTLARLLTALSPRPPERSWWTGAARGSRACWGTSARTRATRS